MKMIGSGGMPSRKSSNVKTGLMEVTRGDTKIQFDQDLEKAEA